MQVAVDYRVKSPSAASQRSGCGRTSVPGFRWFSPSPARHYTSSSALMDRDRGISSSKSRTFGKEYSIGRPGQANMLAADWFTASLRLLLAHFRMGLID